MYRSVYKFRMPTCPFVNVTILVYRTNQKLICQVLFIFFKTCIQYGHFACKHDTMTTYRMYTKLNWQHAPHDIHPFTCVYHNMKTCHMYTSWYDIMPHANNIKCHTFASLHDNICHTFSERNDVAHINIFSWFSNRFNFIFLNVIAG